MLKTGKWVTRHTARGHPYPDWEPPVPRIQDQYLDGTVYLYRSRHEAEEGINIGGSGFLVSVPCEKLPAPMKFVYAVTNRHVIEHGAYCVRINTKDGKSDVLERKLSHWAQSANDDLAACLMPGNLFYHYSARSLNIEQLLTEDQARDYAVGPGDEVVAIGRFINHEGKQRNNPTVRFGFISQNPQEPIEYEGQSQDSFLCEVKSIGGYSGSPVFLSSDPRDVRPDGASRLPHDLTYLLGVDWAHIQNWEPAHDQDGYELANIRFPTNTGMMAVVPAWKLRGLLMTDTLNDERKTLEDNEIKRRDAPKVSRDSSTNETPFPTIDANPNHRGDFMRLVDVAARKQKQGE